MKIRLINIFLFLLIAEHILSLPQVAVTFQNVRPVGFSLLGVLRFASLPALTFLFISKFKKRKVNIIGSLFGLEMILPTILFVAILIFQIFSIPEAALPRHFSGSSNYVFRNLLYLCIVLNLSSKTGKKLLEVIPLIFCITFIVAIIQYPFNIAFSGLGIGDVLASYRPSGRVQFFGLFSAANEDANAMVTLLPFTLLYIEKLNGMRKYIIRNFLLAIMPFILLFNGTRTALFIGFPLVLLLYYSNLAIKQIAKLSIFLIPIFCFIVLISYDFIAAAFAGESASGGTLGWRMRTLWTPAVTYTNQVSPLLGFGSNGWDYLVRTLDLAFGPGQSPAHNLYVWFYAGWGILGLAVLLFFLVGLLRSSFELSKLQQKDLALLSKTCFCSICAYMIWGCISNAFMPTGWNILYGIGMIIASIRVINAEKFKANQLASSNLSKVKNPFLRRKGFS